MLHLTSSSQAAYSVQFLFAVAVGFSKIGITITLHRIFASVSNKFRWATFIVMGLCIVWMVFTILIGLFICWPITMNWDPDTPGGKCGDQIAAFSAVGIIDVATDLVIIALPIPMIYPLQIRWQHKVALCSIFGAGLL